jgi:hypothetical protein
LEVIAYTYLRKEVFATYAVLHSMRVEEKMETYG